MKRKDYITYKLKQSYQRCLDGNTVYFLVRNSRYIAVDSPISKKVPLMWAVWVLLTQDFP